jgi:hypothetical protein
VSGGVRKCTKCGTYNAGDSVCGCWGTLPNARLVPDYIVPTLPDFRAGPNTVSHLQTLPTDSAARKEYPLYRGCFQYFPAALAGVSRISKLGNDKHNPGQEMHHARGKSTDHGDCILRHLLDLSELLAGYKIEPRLDTAQQIKDEASSLAWRALALSQELHERFGAPMAPGAKD